MSVIQYGQWREAYSLIFPGNLMIHGTNFKILLNVIDFPDEHIHFQLDISEYLIPDMPLNILKM